MTAAPEHQAVSEDVFLGGALRILQPTAGLRAGLDAVMLAAAVRPAVGARILDAGAGVGVVGLAVARRCAQAHVQVMLVERVPKLADLARQNSLLNGLGAQIDVVCTDLTLPLSKLRELGIQPETYDHVLANPPFYDVATVRLSPRDLKAAASTFGAGELEHWLRFAAATAKPGGRLTLIHRADALAEILAGIGTRFGGLTIFPLFARDGEAAVRVIVQGVKGSRAPLEMRRGLVLHTRGGGFTPAAEAVLRGGEALDLQGP